MPSIKQIGNLPPEFRRTERNEKHAGVKKTTSGSLQTPATDQTPAGIQDQVNLSESARVLLQREMEVQKYAEQMPDISTLHRQEQEEIEAKIEDGFYSSPEVMGDVAARIADTELSSAETESATRLSSARLQELVQNIQNKQYDREDVLKSIADKIMKEL